MELVLTLIAAPGGLDEPPIRDAREILAALGVRPAQPRWLAPEEACDLPFEAEAAEGGPAGIEAALRESLGAAPIDLAVQPARGRRKRLLLADMDSTIVIGETLDELADCAGLKPEIAAITAQAMAGELDFEAALRRRVALLEGLPAEALERTRAGIALGPGARALVATMKAAGAYCALISGGFTQFTEHVAAACGFDEHRANRLLIEDGKLTGRVAEPIQGRDAKRRALLELLERRGLAAEAACTVGDGANDIDMLTAAGLGVAYRAKPAVRAAAPVRIDRGDLTALLYLQGFAKSELAA